MFLQESRADVEGLRLNMDQMKRHLDENRFQRYLSAFGIKKLEQWATACLP
ncbi:MAG: hypothetical protein SWC96_00310 [Thermodesulfobacteriota bacterium]|nr:hypothetical protein [Thermodesulfobacteriota bacterium]